MERRKIRYKKIEQPLHCLGWLLLCNALRFYKITVMIMKNIAKTTAAVTATKVQIVSISIVI